MPKVAAKTGRKGRRKPVQGRSQATVDALLAAAAQILARSGPEAATTNAIAARAGVSIGSLYQYFPDKDALIDVLATRHVDQMSAVMFAELADTGARTFAEAAAGLVAAILAAQRVNPRLHHALHQILPRQKMSTMDRLEAALETRVAALLAEREGLAPAVAERTAVVLVRSIGGAVRTTLRRDPERLEDPALERALTRIIVDCVAAARQGSG